MGNGCFELFSGYADISSTNKMQFLLRFPVQCNQGYAGSERTISKRKIIALPKVAE
jgi:hypothetical protein